jgi:branched-chain amino acid transport system permease protein
VIRHPGQVQPHGLDRPAGVAGAQRGDDRPVVPLVLLPRLRGDFAAVGLLVTAVLLNLLAMNFVPAFNGDAGLSLIPQPLQGEFIPQSSGYQWGFTVVALLLCAAVYLFLRRVTESPYGRTLRAMRDNDAVADSLGKNLLSLRTGMLVLGGAIAGLSGGVLVSYITTWSPAAWGYAETVVLFAAVIIGGTGNHRGALLGAVLVPVGFEEVTRFIPTSNNLPPNLIPSLEWVAGAGRVSPARRDARARRGQTQRR